MAFVKAFFTALFVALALMVGVLAVIGVFQFLIMSIDFKIYGYLVSVIWGSFFSLYFLSLLPVYPKEENSVTPKYIEAVKVPRFIAVLLSIIIIPIIAAYTLIILLYIMTNITGDFWQESQLEPLLIGYVISGWVTLFLVYGLEQKNAVLYKNIFLILF